MICTPHPILFGLLNGRGGGRKLVCEGRKGIVEFWCKNLKKKDNLEDLGVDGEIILKQTFKKKDEMALTRLIWLRIETSEGLL
jgi:hypothetical protein